MYRAFLAAIALLWTANASNAAIIQLNYTGTYTASWSGNYDPGGVPTGVNDFHMSFIFNTEQADFSTSTEAGTSDPPFNSTFGFVYGPVELFGNWSGSLSVSDSGVSVGIVEVYLGRDRMFSSINMSSSGGAGNLLTSYALHSVSGQGSAVITYANTDLGGGHIRYDFTPLTLSIAVDGAITQAVPEPSTWVMILLGFCGVAAISKRRKRQASKATS